VHAITDEGHFAILAGIPEKRVRELMDFWRTDTERVDAEDLNCLAQAILAVTQYIDDQDESDESGNIDTANRALTLLSTLVQVEAAEVEPLEPEDEGEYSAPDATGRVTAPDATAGRGPVPVEGPVKATPTTDSRYLSKRRKAKPSWRLS